ncbi:protein of unknown function (DU1801) [Rhodococcus maanshanensis]|uniref:YdhG-like domain-containing protein n=1 Tax=Rhodococcus maanshanensis TaxID=183556 RepID=A0A1H7U2P1_9NOCA|nr:protein of unknown function (DU1801) [Rhodococcus maanshanensis]
MAAGANGDTESVANKTQPTGADVEEFLGTLTDDVTRADCGHLIDLMRAATGEPAAMWGPSIIGFGNRTYRYASGHHGNTALIGFAPRSTALVLYLSLDLDDHRDALQRLGKHRTGKGCLYIKRLADVDESELRALIESSVRAARALSADS